MCNLDSFVLYLSQFQQWRVHVSSRSGETSALAVSPKSGVSALEKSRFQELSIPILTAVTSTMKQSFMRHWRTLRSSTFRLSQKKVLCRSNISQSIITSLLLWQTTYNPTLNIKVFPQGFTNGMAHCSIKYRIFLPREQKMQISSTFVIVKASLCFLVITIGLLTIHLYQSIFGCQIGRRLPSTRSCQQPQHRRCTF